MTVIVYENRKYLVELIDPPVEFVDPAGIPYTLNYQVVNLEHGTVEGRVITLPDAKRYADTLQEMLAPWDTIEDLLGGETDESTH